MVLNLKNAEEISVHWTEELSSSPCRSIDSYIERMNILDSSENYTQGNTSIDSDETNVDADTAASFMETVNENFKIEDRPSVSGSENNPVLEVEDNLNHQRPPLTPIFDKVLPPTGEVNYNALQSLASFDSVIKCFVYC